MKYIFVSLTLFFSLSFSLSINCQNFNRPVPPGVVINYEFVQYDTTDYGFYLTTPLSMLTSKKILPKPRMALLDKNGYLTWFSLGTSFRHYNFQYHPDTNLFSCYYQNDPLGYLMLDSAFNFVDTFNIIDGLYVNPHDFLILKNGNIALILYKDSIMDLSAYTFNGVQGSATTKVIGDILIEIDKNRNIVFRWSSFDHIPHTEAYEEYGYYANGYDYTHSNAIAEDYDGNFLVSFRHLNSIFKIDRTSGNIIWRLGGKFNNFTFINDIGFSGQHDIRSYPDGSYSTFDNAATTTNECRAIRYLIDTMNWTATKIWEHKPNPPFPALLMGNYQITPDSNHLINYGTTRRPYPTFNFFDNQGNIISEVFFQDSTSSYRTFIFKLPFEFPRPAIACTLATNALKLIAPPGFQSYLWSTGETTQEITVSDTGGVYQVWVNYGVGMLGSHPFFVNDSNNCAPMSINEYELLKPEGDYEIFDLLGRKTRQPLKGHIYIYRYQNGYSELKYYMMD